MARLSGARAGVDQVRAVFLFTLNRKNLTETQWSVKLIFHLFIRALEIQVAVVGN